jgi:hypothetical protein
VLILFFGKNKLIYSPVSKALDSIKMEYLTMKRKIIALTLMSVFVAPVLAEKPDWAGKEKPGKEMKEIDKAVMEAEESAVEDELLKEKKAKQEKQVKEEKKTKKEKQGKQEMKADQDKKSTQLKGMEKQQAKKQEQVQKEIDKGSDKGKEAREKNRKKWWKFWGE